MFGTGIKFTRQRHRFFHVLVFEPTAEGFASGESGAEFACDANGVVVEADRTALYLAYVSGERPVEPGVVEGRRSTELEIIGVQCHFNFVSLREPVNRCRCGALYDETVIASSAPTRSPRRPPPSTERLVTLSSPRIVLAITPPSSPPYRP